MRAILLILIVAVVALVIAIATGFLDISQTRSAQVPKISTTDNGVVAKGGQAPAFDVETGSVAVGTKKADVTVPTVQVKPPSEEDVNAVNQQ
jgi:hypothetical protein